MGLAAADLPGSSRPKSVGLERSGAWAALQRRSARSRQPDRRRLALRAAEGLLALRPGGDRHRHPGRSGGADADSSGTLHIGVGKTDREDAGGHASLSPATMRAIEAWRRSGGLLSRWVDTYFVVRSCRWGGRAPAEQRWPDLQAANPSRVREEAAPRALRGRDGELGRGGIESLDPDRCGAGQSCRRRRTAHDQAGIAMARSEDGAAIQHQAGSEERRQRSPGQALLANSIRGNLAACSCTRDATTVLLVSANAKGYA